MGWADVNDVLVMTGRTITASTLAMADSVITIYANRTIDASAGMTQRDLYWLRSATAWQGAWQDQQPGFNQRSAAGSVIQDGTQVQYDQEWEITLAPMAARALRNLSWKGSRSLRVAPVWVRAGRAAEFALESSDEYHAWSERV